MTAMMVHINYRLFQNSLLDHLSHPVYNDKPGHPLYWLTIYVYIHVKNCSRKASRHEFLGKALQDKISSRALRGKKSVTLFV